MTTQSNRPGFFSLNCDKPIWDKFFQVFPLVVVGTKEPDGGVDLAPKHMAMPVSWQNHFGFVCTPAHRTYQNIRREGCFTVSYPRPDQVVLASLAASPRCEDNTKANISALPTFPASQVDGVFLEGGYLYLECVLERIIDDLGVNSLVIGKVVAALVEEHNLVGSERQVEQEIHSHPLLAYVHPMRFAAVEETLQFPLPAGFKK